MFQLTSRVRVLFGRRPRQVGLVVFGIAMILSLVAMPVWFDRPAEAATNNTLNFQARLQTNAGALVPDGFYNIQFNLYDVSGGGSTLWTETYLVSNTQGVRVKNGYVSVNLGSITSFPSLNWDQDLWLGITVRGTGSCAFAACTPADSEMTPRLKLTGVPYAFRAGELAKLNSGNGFTSILRFQNATGGSQIFEIPNQGAGNTYTLLTTNTADAAYIQNTTSPQTANFNITGNGTIGTNLSVSGNFSQTGSGTFGTATGAVSLNGDATVASGKTLTVTAGASSLTGPSGGSSVALAVGSGATSNVGLRVSAVSSQTANILEVIDGASNTVLTIAATGKVSFAAKPTAVGSDGAIELGSIASQSSNDINGVIGFLGTGVGHAQIAYSVGDGFYLCNSSSSSPSGDYGQCSSRVNLYGQTGNFNNGLNITSGNIVQSGSGTFATATGAISLNGDATVAAGKTLRFANGSNSNIVTVQSGTTGASYSLTLPTALGSSGDCLKDTNGSGVLGFASCGGGSGVTTVGAFSGSSQTNGATISGTTITFGPADATNPGMVNVGAQTIAGAKTLTSGATNAVPLTIQGESGQTANLLQVKNNSSGTTVLTIAADGTTTFQGVQPASSTGNGTNAPATSHTITGTAGGNTTGTTGQTAGEGSDVNVTAGAGGTAATGSTGGQGGILYLSGGNGGNAPAGGTTGAGGAVIIQGGAVGGGGGTPNFFGNGSVILQPSSGHTAIGTLAPANRLSINDLTTADSAAQVAIGTRTTTSKGLIIQGVASQSADLLQLQTSAGPVTGTVFSIGATGLITSVGGLTLTGAVSINTTGNANTAIGNATGMLTLTSNAFNVSNTGAISGVTGYAQGSGNFAISGTGTFSTGTGAITLNGDTTLANDKTLTINTPSGVNAALSVTGTNSNSFLVRTNSGFRVSVGNATNCSSGRFCVEQAVNGGTAGFFYNLYNTQTIDSTGGSNTVTGVGQNISIQDTGSTVGNVIRGIFLDTTGTTNGSTEIQGIWVRNPSSNTGNLLRLQTGTTDRFLISNTAALSHTYGATGSSTAHTLTLNSASGTQTNGILVNRNGSGGTTTNGIHITQTAGNITHGLTFSGTFDTNLINAPNFTVSNGGAITAVGVNSGSGQIQGSGGMSLTGTTNINNSGSASTTIGNSNGAISLSGDTTVATGRTLILNGITRLTKGTDYSTIGTSNNVDFGTTSFVRLTGASAQTITGIANGADGRVLTITNAGSATATMSNNSGSSTAANRITTGTGGDISLPVGASISLIYDPTGSLWRVVGTPAGNGSGVTTVGTFSGSSQTNGASIAGTTITFGPADGTNPGMVSTGTQTIAGDKTLTGATLVRNSSATGFQVQNAGSTAQLTVDNSASRVILGTSGGDTTGTLLVLGNKTNTGDPTGVAGAMYYNSALGAFRCYEVNYWRDCLQSPRTSYRYDQDFTTTLDSWDQWPVDATFDYASSPTDAGIGQVTSEASHPGIVQFQTGTNASGWVSAWMWDQNDANVVFGSDYWRFETVLRIPTLSGSGQTFYVRAGFMDGNGTNSDGTDGCFFRYTDTVNSGRWQGVCISNGTSSTCDTGTSPSSAPATNTWHRLTVAVNAAGTSADFRINGTSRCTVSTNIPTGSTRATSAQMAVSKTGGTTNRNVDFDYMGWESQFTTSR